MTLARHERLQRQNTCGRDSCELPRFEHPSEEYPTRTKHLKYQNAEMSQPNQTEATAPDSTPSSISAAAHAYQVAMQQQSSTPGSTPAQISDTTRDVVMTDNTPDRPAVSRYNQLSRMELTDNLTSPLLLLLVLRMLLAQCLQGPALLRAI